jgi:hypothetical protein
MRERERRDKSSGEARTEVGIPYVLEALAPITITTFCTRLGVITLLITARGGPLTAHDSDLFPAHPVERRATDVERPDIVGRLQTVPAGRIPRSCSGTAPSYARVAEEEPLLS